MEHIVVCLTLHLSLEDALLALGLLINERKHKAAVGEFFVCVISVFGDGMKIKICKLLFCDTIQDPSMAVVLQAVNAIHE